MKKSIKGYSLYFVLLSIIGIIFTYILVQESHFGSIYKEYGDKLSIYSDISRSACGEKESKINCYAVETSKFSKIFNIPLTSFGMFYFLLMAFFSFMIVFGNRFYSKNIFLFFWFIAIGSIVDLVLLFIMIFFIKAFCPFCIATYLVNWTALVLLIKYFRDGKENPFQFIGNLKAMYTLSKSGSVKYLLLTGAVMVLFLFLGFGMDTYLSREKMHFIKQKEESLADNIVKEFVKEKSADIKVSKRSVIGSPDAPVTIVEFSDFLCQHCKDASEVLLSIFYENPGKIKIIFINFPLDIKCNAGMSRQLHEGACELAKGAICASAQGKFGKYSETVFGLQLKSVGSRELDQIANYAGLDKKRFGECMANPETEKELLNQIKTADAMDINKTPVLFINGKQYRNKINRNIIEKIISEELKKKGK
jgi:protein-disulfide isomerase/uncharacterized membrane protein